LNHQPDIKAMFQSFETKSAPQFGRERVQALRAKLDALGVDAFLVPRADEYQGEYVPASAERLSWLTGFTGSAGMGLITKREAVIFVDGRYVTQLAEQVDGQVFTGGDLVNEPPHVWLSRHAAKGLRLGIDPWLHAGAEVRRLQKALEELGGSLLTLSSNPLDEIWTDRPAEPLEPVSIQKKEHAGRPAAEKIAEISSKVRDKGAAAVLITDPSSVAWIFNIRGNDVPHTPHPLSRAIISAAGKAEIFLDRRKLGGEQAEYLQDLATVKEPSALMERLADVARDGGRVMIDPDLTPLALAVAIEKAGGVAVEAGDPAKLPRACKNAAELQGSAQAHLQDGAAVVEFLCWLDEQAPGSITEIDAVKALEAARARVGQSMQNPLKDISFDTISGAGEHAAIMHYRVTSESNRAIAAGELFLIDSGAQYINGTTDITRTVAVGAVPEDHKRFFTLVLKGMIGISIARFPKGTRGCDLDPLARIALWKAGGDFAHGTGHGVGSYLSVHEGPQRIARLATQELLPGMILSNEPGYYRPGSYGIRIENLIHVKGAEDIEGGDQPMLSFATLTWCPIDRRLVLSELLTAEELAWLNGYHADVRERLLPLIDKQDVRDWLVRATEAIA
jgi:Xaa-Pro aminopeptidase